MADVGTPPIAARTRPRWSRLREWGHPVQSLRVRITLAAVLVTTLAVWAVGWLLVRSVEDAQIREIRQNIEANLDHVAEQLEDGVDAEAALDAAMPQLGYVKIVDASGTLITERRTAAGNGSEQDGDAGGPRPRSEGSSSAGLGLGDTQAQSRSADEVVTTKNGTTLDPAHADGTAMQAISRTVLTNDGLLTITGEAPVDEVARSIAALRRGLLVGLPALVGLVGAVAYVVVGRALRPVDAMRAEVDAISGSTMHRRVPEPPTSDEIGRLAHTMNAMLDRLDTAASRQRQFVSDASHELRSPVAAIRTSVEVARRKGGAADWTAVSDAVLAEEARLEALLDDLLVLATDDEARSAPMRAVPVDLSDLTVEEAGRPRRVPVNAAGAAAVDGPVAVPGVEDQLVRVVSHLLDNAARHATTEVHVGLVPGVGAVDLVIDDDGPGVPAAEREQIFERFARLDDSRARDKGGSGLGLAIVRSIATRHGGSAWVDDSPFGGARFVVRLPTS